MAHATVMEVTTFVCSECGEEIDRCDNCDHVFEADEGISCTDQGHICPACTGEWREAWNHE